MPRLLSPLILFPVFLLGELGAAEASPNLLHPLSDGELASNCAGQAVTIRFEDHAQVGPMPATARDEIPTQTLFGIRTIARDSGALSLSEAVTAITLKATLARVDR